MKNSARFIKYLMLAVVLITLAAHALSKEAWAASGNTQICIVGVSCTVGEFVYNDSYSPENSATCQITARYPNGTLYLNASSMTHASENDGWYYYTFTTPSTTGLYRTEVKCTIGSDIIALDKSFEVQEAPATPPSAGDIAAATWSYSTRSLSTFGSIVSDFWSAATRTLTGAGLSSGSLATKSEVDDKVNSKTDEIKDEIKKVSTSSSTAVTDISSLKKTVNETRNLVEKLVNKPIIQTTTEDVPDLNAKLKETDKRVSQLYIDAQSQNSKINTILKNWNRISEDQIINTVEGLSIKIGGENDPSSSKSLFGNISYLNNEWDWNSIKIVNKKIVTIRDVSVSFQQELDRNGKSTASFAKIKILAALLTQLSNSIGDTSDESSNISLYGTLNETKLIASSLDNRSKDVENILVKWNSYKFQDIQTKILSISRKLVEINKVPGVRNSLLSTNSTTDKELKNKSYYVLGIISTNKKLLAKKTGLPLANTWLELGSIVFKSIVTNPSTLISQDVELKYYLPEELKKEDIIETDPSLEVKFDTQENKYYVIGNYYLAPSESQTVSVRTQDIWVISKEEVNSLRKQADELSRPLEKTSYFAQGVTLDSDINVSLDKVELLMKSNTTPEMKIKSYREAQVELKAAHEKIEKLKELATQAGSVGTFFGFVGGVQTLAVWGLIIILVAGFVFLALYMKLISRKESKKSKIKSSAEEKTDDRREFVTITKSKPKLKYAVGISMLLFLLIGTGIGGVSGVIISKNILVPREVEKSLAKADSGKKVLAENTVSEKINEPILIKIVVPEGSKINVRNKPSKSSEVISKLSRTSEFEKIDEKDDWVKISSISGELKDIEEGWVSKEFVEASEPDQISK